MRDRIWSRSEVAQDSVSVVATQEVWSTTKAHGRDWVFASPHKKGKQPYWLGALFRAHLQPALKAADSRQRGMAYFATHVRHFDEGEWRRHEDDPGTSTPFDSPLPYQELIVILFFLWGISLYATRKNQTEYERRVIFDDIMPPAVETLDLTFRR
jgi:hypothetical protein